MLEPNATAIQDHIVNTDDVPSGTAAWFERSILGVLPDLVSTARRLTRNATDAEDLVAEAVAKAWVGLPGLKDRARFRGWIFRILSNEFLAQRRSRTSQPETDALPDETGVSPFSRSCISRSSCGGAIRRESFWTSCSVKTSSAPSTACPRLFVLSSSSRTFRVSHINKSPTR